MFEWTNWLGTLIAVAIAFLIVVVVAVILMAIKAGVGKRVPFLSAMITQLRKRTLLFALVIALWIACGATAPGDYSWWPAVSRGFFIVTVVAGAWLITGLASFGFGRLLGREAMAQAALPDVRRMRTQLLVLRRLVTVLISIVALGVVLFSFPEVRAIGTSVLASAGIVSIIAGLAAQSTLGNLIAGIQLVFSNAIRVDDIVIVEGNWGTISEITLGYVVVHVWDDRMIILPCTYFTTQPFESWTRNSDLIKGTVYLDVDWRFPVEEARARFMELVQGSDDWDGRSASMVVYDAVGGHLSVRFTVSAKDSDDIWTLRCRVREEMVTWLQQNHPEALPMTRVLLPEAAPADEPEAAQS